MVVWSLVKKAQQKPFRILIPLSISALILGGCTQGESAGDIGENMGNATAMASPAAINPSGEVLMAGTKIMDLEQAEEIIAVRTNNQVLLGRIDDFRTSATRAIELDPECADMTATKSEFIVACPDAVMVIDAQSFKITTVTTSKPVTTAVKTSTGVILAGIKEQARLIKITPDGQEKELATEYPTDEMIAIEVPEKTDAVVRINRSYTLVQQVEWESENFGALLRVGKGVGQISPGERGMFIASDTIGGQVALYFSDDIVRLNKTYPVGQSPWAVAWDSSNQRVLVATTSDNTIASYSQSDGSMHQEASFASIAGVHNIVVLASGTIVATSATSDGMQIIEQ
ncbi:Prolipoprotein LppL [Corynebacterium kutscheri]|uniref:Uncharacterized protein n=1 Tax=Corynebacterium kutscheri TaxID=35755 RepID=A0A0F6R0C7_9CORY|nr:hypothetical protein UL82_05270 [Corynebacterium kutscheri]VEH09552.1 Prolipoprotein LppL [Corynebacterium kutscheri]VEH79635.1 Prolipoprotein LppL [Corynebacterium kutscheri]